jgi:hypothetical protein
LSNRKKDYVDNLVKLCLEIDDISDRIELVNSINDVLPYGFKIKIPSLLTNNLINQRLYSLEERLPRIFFDA